MSSSTSAPQKKNYSIKTFGCKVNTYDSGLIQKNLEDKTWSRKDLNDTQEAVHIVNTCAVTEEAVKEAKRWIRRYRKKHPQKTILVTGCAAQVETQIFSELKEVDLVVANSHKSELADIMNQYSSRDHNSSKNHNSPKDNNSSQDYNDQFIEQKTFNDSIFKKHSLGKYGGLESSHTRLFLKIQDGCDSFCTFCIIPFARGKSRSIPPMDLVESIQSHYEKGVREVVLTGVHIGDYTIPGNSHKNGLADLVSILLNKTKMPRIRLSSLEPIELSEQLMELFSSPRLCPHFHLSVQSAHSEVLQKMKRKYKAKDVEKTLTNIYKKLPGAFVGMDIIAGFAGESQKQFEESYLRLKDLPWTKMHVFPYSPRQYTYAHRVYTSWPRSLILKRASLLRHLSEGRFKTEIKKQIGQIKYVLPLKSLSFTGISRDYWTVKWNSLSPLTNSDLTNSDLKSNKKVIKGEEEPFVVNTANNKYFKKEEGLSVIHPPNNKNLFNEELSVVIESVDEEKGHLYAHPL